MTGPPPQWPAPQPPAAPAAGREPVERPADIDFSAVAWLVTIVLATVSTAFRIWELLHSSQWRDEFEKNLDKGGLIGRSMAQYADFADYQRDSLVMAYVMLAAVVVASGVLVLLMWKGQRWARLLLQVGGALVLAQGLLAIFSVADAWIAVPIILAAIVSIAALITGNSRDSIRYLTGPRR